MKLILIRHGDADDKVEGTPLTKKGLEQAKKLAKELRKQKFDKIYSSTLLRAKQTCEEYTKDYTEDERLKEVYRVLIGGPDKEGTSPGREEIDQKNADEIFEELINSKEKKILVFAHANIIRYFVKKIQVLNNENLWQDMIIDNCSMTIIEKNKDELLVREINNNNHFEGDYNIEYIEE
ncbi:MAG: histidine phosphatase family protein [Nanoarchaeota archaeon]|jgi:probable phosphoglycerate mutase|nr:histidine phosphatase family protein [Nanoarchaeota archaeon]